MCWYKVRRKVWAKMLTFLVCITTILSGLVNTNLLKAESLPAIVEVENKDIIEGSQSTLSVVAKNVPLPGLAGYRIQITYDAEVIEVISIKESSEFAKPTYNIITPGEILVNAAQEDGTTGDIQLFDITVKAIGSAGKTSSLNLNVVDFTDPNLFEIPNEIVQGSVTISAAFPALEIQSISLPDGQVGNSYNGIVNVMGGTLPYHFEVDILPNGLEIDPVTGVISGTPIVPATSQINLTVSDSSQPQQVVTEQLSITVNSPNLSFIPPVVPSILVNSPISIPLTAAGGNGEYTWSSVNLPTGLILDSKTGLLSGSLDQIGNYEFEILVADQYGQQVSGIIEIVISPIPLSVQPDAKFPDGTFGESYQAGPIQVSGGNQPYTWSANPEELPPGLQLSESGIISGIPIKSGLFNVTFIVSDSTTPAQTKSFILSIRIKATSLNLITTNLPDGQLGQNYSAEIDISGGVEPYTFEASGLPDGLTLDNLTGLISGIPNKLGLFNVFVSVRDKDGQLKSVNLRINITEKLFLYLKDNPQDNNFTTATVGEIYRAELAATGGKAPVKFELAPNSVLPVGLTLDSLTGIISGIPLEKGTSQLSIKVTDSSNPAQMSQQPFMLEVLDQLKSKNEVLPTARTGQNYGYALSNLVSGGKIPYTFTLDISKLPPGLSYNASTMEIVGIPQAAGIYPISISAVDSMNHTLQFNINFIVEQAPPQLGIVEDESTGSSVNALAWSIGAPLNLDNAKLSSYAGDKLSLSGALLPNNSVAVLLSTGIDKRTWSLQTTPNQDQFAVQLPKDLPTGRYILSIAIPGGPYAEKAVLLDVNPAWYVTTRIDPFGTQSRNAVTSDLNLLTTVDTVPDLTITWSSSAPTIVETTGVVRRPSYKLGDQAVTLTATLVWGQSPNAYTQVKRYTLNVKAQEATEYERLELAVGNLNALMPAQNKLDTLVDNQDLLKFPISIQDVLDPNQLWYIVWEATDESSGSVDQYLQIDLDGTIRVIGRPLNEEGNKSIKLTAHIGNDLTRIDKEFTAVVLAQTKTPIVLAGQLQSLEEQLNDLSQPIDMAALMNNFSDLTQSALDSTNALNSEGYPSVTTLIQQMQNILGSLLSRLSPTPSLLATKTLNADTGDTPSEIGVATVIRNAVDAATSVVLRTDFNKDTLNEGILSVESLLTPSLISEIQELSISSDPAVQEVYTEILNKLSRVYDQITLVATDKYNLQAGIDGSLPSGSVSSSAEGLANSISGLSTSLMNLNVSLKKVDLHISSPVQSVLVPSSEISTLVQNNLGLTVDNGSKVSLPTEILDSIQSHASGNIAINSALIPENDESLQNMPLGSNLMSAPYRITIMGGSNEIQISGFNENPAEVSLPINNEVSLSTLADLMSKNNVVVRYYDTNIKAWLNLSSPNLRIDTLSRKIIFNTPHFTDFVVTTISSDTSLVSLKVSVPGKESLELWPTPYTLTESIENGITLEIIPSDPQASISVNGNALKKSGNGTNTGSYALDLGENKFNVSVTAEDGTSEDYLITVIGVNPLTLAKLDLPSAELKSPYSADLETLLIPSGGSGNYTWEVSGLPAGLNLVNGIVEGTPVEAGTTPFLLTIKDDGTPQQVISESISLTVDPEPLEITTSVLSQGTLDQAYLALLTAIGGCTPYSWSIENGSLPSGLTLDPSGAIKGTIKNAALGSYPITLKATDQEGRFVIKSLEIVVTASPLEITTFELAEATVGINYNAILEAKGGIGQYTWSILNKPSWLVLDSNTGALSGIPESSGTLQLAVKVSDSELPIPQTYQKDIQLISNPAPLALVTNSLPVGMIGEVYEVQLKASGGITPYTWIITGLPEGWTYDSTSGLIQSTQPITDALLGEIPVSIEVTDQQGSKDIETYILSITHSSLSILTTELPKGIVEKPYSVILQALGGVPNYTWEVTGLPTGLSYDANTGEIKGQVDTEVLSKLISITLRDSNNGVQSIELLLSIESETAATIASRITAISAPLKDQKTLILPQVPEGFIVSIKTSDNPSVISIDGSITPPDQDVRVSLILQVTRLSDSSNADTELISVLVPAKSTLAGKEFTLTVGEKLGRSDKVGADFVRIPVSVNVVGISQYSFDIVYDPTKLIPTSVSGEGIKAIAVPLNDDISSKSSTGRIHVSWNGSETTSTGKLFNTIFSIKEGLTATEKTAISIENAAFIIDEVTSNNATYTEGAVYYGMYGDLTGDGNVNNFDIGLLRQAYKKVRTLTEIQFKAADVIPSNSLNNFDIGALIQKYKGAIKNFQAEF